jgi:hypothetical protein
MRKRLYPLASLALLGLFFVGSAGATSSPAVSHQQTTVNGISANVIIVNQFDPGVSLEVSQPGGRWGTTRRGCPLWASPLIPPGPIPADGAQEIRCGNP